ncbi:MAG: GNAT family N-acetyltransferase [Lachnospiraceae bacterium]|nr:GNAT family N-acetyltransferase [Lachnospiraceae bacterium]
MQFETKRLILRSSDANFAKDVLEFYKDNKESFEAVEPFDTPDFYTFSIQQRNLRAESRLISEGRMVRFWIFPKNEPHKIIGTFSLLNVRQASFKSATIGYKMDKCYRRFGYCKEAILFGLDFAKNTMGLHRIEALIQPSNKASIALIESVGFEREGLLRQNVKLLGEWKDHYLYSKIFN